MRPLLILPFMALLSDASWAQSSSNGQQQVGVSNAPSQMPFMRLGDPVILPATTTPRQYQIPQPNDPITGQPAVSYRFVNPCSVDVRIRTVSNMTETVTATTGTRFIARTAETLASSPSLTTPRTVSIMTMADPGGPGCSAELQYGRGG